MNKILIFGIIFFLLSCVHAESLNECPDEKSVKILLGIEPVKVAAQKTTGLIRRVRLPEIGLFEDNISCLLATDTSLVGNGGEVTVTDGGLNHKYVEIRLQSQIGEPLDYMVVVYADYKENLNKTSVLN